MSSLINIHSSTSETILEPTRHDGVGSSQTQAYFRVFDCYHCYQCTTSQWSRPALQIIAIRLHLRRHQKTRVWEFDQGYSGGARVSSRVLLMMNSGKAKMSPECEPAVLPDAIVALAVAALSNSSSFDAAELQSNNATLHNGLTPVLHERTVVVLDALAKLSILDQEVVAVSLRIHEGAQGPPFPEFMFSTNNLPTNTITAHLTSLWLVLRKLSNEKFKTCFPRAALWERSPALDMTEAHLQNLYNQIFHEAYRHSYINLQRRYNRVSEVMVHREFYTKSGCFQRPNIQQLRGNPILKS